LGADESALREALLTLGVLPDDPRASLVVELYRELYRRGHGNPLPMDEAVEFIRAREPELTAGQARWVIDDFWCRAWQITELSDGKGGVVKALVPIIRR
jgi:hypothetical protein